MQQENSNPKSSFTGTSLYLFAAKFFPALATVAVWMYYSKNLSAEAYGNYQSFWIQLVTVTAIATIGFPIFILTYTPQKAIAILMQLRSKSIGLYGLLLFILAAVFAALQLNANHISPLLTAIFLIVFTGVMLTDALLITCRLFNTVIAINTSYALFFTAIHFLIIKNGYDFVFLIQMLLLVCAIRLLVNSFILKIKTKNYIPEHISAQEAHRIKKLWVQLGINDSIQVLFRWTDKFILSLILAKELFAVYVNATIEIAFLPLIFSAVSSAAVQHWAYHHKGHTAAYQINLLHYSSRILSSIVFPLFFFLFFFREAFLTTIFSAHYASGVWIFVCAQLVLPVRAYPFTALLQSHHRGDLINKGSLIDFILACVLMYPLYLMLGLPGVALSFVISTYWQAGYYLTQSSLLLQLPIRQLIPSGMLLRRFFFYALLFGTGYWGITHLFSTTKTIFWSGIILLFSSGILSLLYEWHKNNTINEHTSQ